jgi:hypothetical protein
VIAIPDEEGVMSDDKRWSWNVTPGVLALALAACQCYYETPRPTQFAGVDVDNVAVDSIVKYGRGLDYDSVYGAADSQRVDFATGRIGSGDWAIIQPEKGAWALDEKELAEGRIVARIRSHSVYAPFGYGPWWTYWWVDKQGRQWRSLLISDSLKTRVHDTLPHTTTYDTHVGYEWRQSVARWKGSQWASCSRSACCTRE